MKSSTDIIDAVGRALGNVSDAEIAKATGILPSTISTVRAGRRSLPPVDCKKAALVLGVEPSALFLIAAGERQKDRTLKASCFRLARTALPVIAAMGISVAPAPPAQASSAPQQSGPMFIMSNRRRPTRRPDVSQTPTPNKVIHSATYTKNLQKVTKRPILTLSTSPTLD